MGADGVTARHDLKFPLQWPGLPPGAGEAAPGEGAFRSYGSSGGVPRTWWETAVRNCRFQEETLYTLLVRFAIESNQGLAGTEQNLRFCEGRRVH